AVAGVSGNAYDVGVRLGAINGARNRFDEPQNLVKYVGRNAAVDNSGQEEWSGGTGGHGRRDLRSLLIESAQAILRSEHASAKWGKKLLAKKGSIKLAVAAIARKLVVAVWYLMMGRWTPLEEIDVRLARKVSKIITNVGPEGLRHLGKTRKDLRQETYESLKAGRVYGLDPTKTFQPK